jgi:vacuolar-type H+-ATPase subunit F/Vma7
MIDYKKPVIIAEADITLLFKLFGFETLNSDEIAIDQIISTLEQNIDSYAMIFITSNIVLSPKQRKLMSSLNIPISQLPISSDSNSVEELKRLTEKAVGMSLDKLFTS